MAKLNVQRMRDALRKARDMARRQEHARTMGAVRENDDIKELPATLDGRAVQDCRPDAPGWNAIPGRGVNAWTKVLAYRD